MKDKIVIFWFRRDLRLEDNVGLFTALSSGMKVLPVFVFDSEILIDLPKDDPRVSFIYQSLVKIDQTLKANGSSMKLLFGNPLEQFKNLVETYAVAAVYTNSDYEPYAIQRDQTIKQFLAAQQIEFVSCKDQVVFEKDEIVKADGTAYKIYTPYSKRWLAKLTPFDYAARKSETLLHNFLQSTFEFPTIESIGFQESTIKVFPFDISVELVSNYEATRNFPALSKTSKLSPHLRFGTISVRKCVEEALKTSNQTFLKELIWREFFMQILWHYPSSVTHNFKMQYDAVQWRNNEEDYQNWCTGNTGYPIVDAGMRELNNTGYMHNRVRMITASFLCKHLLIDWKWGEAYFASKLLDFDLAQNVGNWQWVAGTGCDAAPYFRVFNPETQTEKFDKNHDYIKKWVPEYKTNQYPSKIVAHDFARKRALEVYKTGLSE